jgi:hypothetical protein
MNREKLVKQAFEIQDEIEDIEDEILGLQMVKIAFEDTGSPSSAYPAWDKDWSSTIRELEQKKAALIEKGFRIAMTCDFIDRQN